MLKFIWRACRWHLEIYHSFSILWNGKNNCPVALIWMNNGVRTGFSQNQDGLPCYWQDLQRLKLMITHSLQCRLSWYISIFIPSAKILSKASPSIYHIIIITHIKQVKSLHTDLSWDHFNSSQHAETHLWPEKKLSKLAMLGSKSAQEWVATVRVFNSKWSA